jgi:enolase
MKMATEIYRILEKKIINTQRIKSPLLVSDKGAFAPDLEDDRDALILLNASIRDAGYEPEVKIALDMAASAFYKEGFVIFLKISPFVIDRSLNP